MLDLVRDDQLNAEYWNNLEKFSGSRKWGRVLNNVNYHTNVFPKMFIVIADNNVYDQRDDWKTSTNAAEVLCKNAGFKFIRARQELMETHF